MTRAETRQQNRACSSSVRPVNPCQTETRVKAPAFRSLQNQNDARKKTRGPGNGDAAQERVQAKLQQRWLTAGSRHRAGLPREVLVAGRPQGSCCPHYLCSQGTEPGNPGRGHLSSQQGRWDQHPLHPMEGFRLTSPKGCKQPLPSSEALADALTGKPWAPLALLMTCVMPRQRDSSPLKGTEADSDSDFCPAPILGPCL